MTGAFLRLGRAAAIMLVLTAALLWPAAQAGAEEPQIPPKQVLDTLQQEAQQIERRLEANDLSLPQVDAMRRTLDTQLDRLAPLKERLAAQLAPIQERLKALGTIPENSDTPEAPQLAGERERLSQEAAELDAMIKRAESARVLVTSLLDRLANLRRMLFTAELMARGPSLLQPGIFEAALDAIARTYGVIKLETEYRITKQEMDTPLIVALIVPAALILAGLFVLLRLKGIAVRVLADGVTEETPQSRRVAIGAGLTFARILLPTLSLFILFGGIAYSGLLGGQGRLFLNGVGEAGLMVVAAYALGGAFFAPRAPLLRPSILAECDAAASHRWLILLATVVGADHALVRNGEELGLAVEGLALLNTALLTLGGIALWRFIGFIRPPKPPEPALATDADATTGDEPEEDSDADGAEEGARPRSRSLLRPGVAVLRVVARFVAVGSPLLALVGYYAAGRFVFYPLVESIAPLGLCILLYYVVSSLVDRFVGGSEDRAGPTSFTERLRLLPLVVGLFLSAAAFPALLVIWGASPEDLGDLWRQFIEGLTIGEITIAPLDIMTFILVIAIGLVLTDRIKGMLRRSVLPLTGLDQGGREAVSAGAGYLGLIISGLVAISAAGIDLSNLAIVAGALSVGIGFGLQNIVNNFVSGLILLVERPIKTGDWVQIAGTHGTVRKVNVRSTEIETFDRSSMFVPNSELISGTVINWTHSNAHGRVIVAVGVAYDSNPRQVERMLLEVAKGHPLMLRRPAPYVLFRRFGADALEFEIRGILRDVNWILNVESDLNFEIARRFAEEGIEVPFKQADIKLKNAAEIAEALRLSAPPREAAPPKQQSTHQPQHHDEQREPAGMADADGDGGDPH